MVTVAALILLSGIDQTYHVLHGGYAAMWTIVLTVIIGGNVDIWLSNRVNRK